MHKTRKTLVEYWIEIIENCKCLECHLSTEQNLLIFSWIDINLTDNFEYNYEPDRRLNPLENC